MDETLAIKTLESLNISKDDVSLFVNNVKKVALFIAGEYAEKLSIDSYIADLTALFIKDPISFCAAESLTATFKKARLLLESNEYIEFSLSGIEIRVLH